MITFICQNQKGAYLIHAVANSKVTCIVLFWSLGCIAPSNTHTLPPRVNSMNCWQNFMSRTQGRNIIMPLRGWVNWHQK